MAFSKINYGMDFHRRNYRPCADQHPSVRIKAQIFVQGYQVVKSAADAIFKVGVWFPQNVWNLTAECN